MRAHWEQKKKQKIPLLPVGPPPPHQKKKKKKKKKKKTKSLLRLLLGWINILFSKQLVTIFCV
jgi:hypothetical protein